MPHRIAPGLRRPRCHLERQDVGFDRFAHERWQQDDIRGTLSDDGPACRYEGERAGPMPSTSGPEALIFLPRPVLDPAGLLALIRLDETLPAPRSWGRQPA